MNNNDDGNIAKGQRLSEIIEDLIRQGIVYNQTDFAQKVGKSKSFISERMNGRRTITERFAHEISKAIKQINKNYLMNGQGSPTITANNVGNQYTLGDNANINLGGGSCADNCTSIDQCIQLLRNSQKTIDLLIKQRDNAQDIIIRTQDQLVRSQDQLTKAQEQVDKLLSLLSNK